MLDSQKIAAMRIIKEEFKELNRNPMPNLGITVGLIDDNNIFEWKISMIGPRDTCYERGVFFLKIIFKDDYPSSRPEIVFMTPIYHLNVKHFVNGSQPLGNIDLSILNNWKSEYTIKEILSAIFILLNQNNPDCSYDSVNNDKTNEFINNRELFEKKAKYFTKKYANPLYKLKNFTTDWDFTYKN